MAEYLITVHHGKRAYVAAQTESAVDAIKTFNAIRPNIGSHGPAPKVKLWELQEELEHSRKAGNQAQGWLNLTIN